MEASIQDVKPRLVSAGQGFQFLNTVEYRGRFLYSKYNPERAVLSLVEKTEILPETLVLIFSPLLLYGFTELEKKLPYGCKIIAIEADANLENLAKTRINEKKFNLKLFNMNAPMQLEKEITRIISSGKIKRCIRMDFSAGVQFYRELYDGTTNAIQEMIATYWKNRVTLVKFGKLFSRNLILNLKKLSSSLLLQDVERTVEKPILVLGAGEGLDSIDWKKTGRSSFFIIAVDAALSPLLARGTVPDAVVGMESQLAIEKAYLGTKDAIKGSGMIFFADLSSRHEVIDKLGAKTVFFASRYADGIFFDGLKGKGIIKDFILPMGSVGLAAFYIALKIRKNPSVKIYAAGLDFSYTAGATHAKSTMAHKARLFFSGRLKSIDNIDAAFAPGCCHIISKNGKKIITTKLLFSYAKQFSNLFKGNENVFDASPTGVDIGLKRKNLDENDGSESSCKIEFNGMNAERKKITESFIAEEIEVLKKAKSLLSYGEKSEFHGKKNLEEEIREILEKREYLYLHFPDGNRFSTSPSFLNRIRAEIEYFLKLMK